MKIQLGELSDCLGVGEREVRYVLERGFVPAGIPKTPDRGNHRQFGPGQAFWLAIVVKLKQSGLKTPLAARIADYALESLRTVTQNLSWDWTFLPSSGQFDTEHDYLVEVGDMEVIRLVTTANPSVQGRFPLEWVTLKTPRRKARGFQPVVTVQVNLVELARRLQRRVWSAD